jgi:hypothetical protein
MVSFGRHVDDLLSIFDNEFLDYCSGTNAQ